MRNCVLCGMALTLLVAGGGVSDPQSDLPAYGCTRVDSAPVLDGRLEDPCWRGREFVDGFWVFRTGGRAKEQTRFCAVWTAEALYFGVECLEPNIAGLKVAMTARDSGLFVDDSVEIFLDPGRSLKTYYQLAVSVANVQFDGQGYDDKWNGDWKSATSRAEGKWIVECSIPFRVFGLSSPGGEAWGFNLCRNRHAGESNDLSSWSFTPAAFHAPERNGFLLFAGFQADLRRRLKAVEAEVNQIRKKLTSREMKGASPELAASERVAAEKFDGLRRLAFRKEPVTAEEWSQALKDLRQVQSQWTAALWEIKFEVLLAE